MPSYKDLLDELPRYMVKVRQESQLLIESNIWDSISLERLDGWLNNFTSDEEKLLSAMLLDNLIFRSADQTKALLYNAIESILPNMQNLDPLKVIEEKPIIEILSSRLNSDTDIRLVPVIRDTDPPTKSGPSVARLYKRHVNIVDEYMIWPWQIKEYYENGIRLFIFIDDVVGTGKQFSNFIEKLNLEGYTDCQFFYIPLLAYDDGVEFIENKFPFLKVSPVEGVNEDFNFFNRPGTIEVTDLRDLYLEVEKNKINKRFLGKLSLGYEKLSLTFSYDHATPNATLPLYWFEDENFYPLVKR